MGFNSLSGEIPGPFYSLRNLEYLDLSSNKLRGSLSSEFGYLRNLTKVSLDSNEFYGTFPQAFGSMERLEYLNVSNTYVTGVFPDFSAVARRGGIVALNNTCLTNPSAGATVRSSTDCENFYASIAPGPRTLTTGRTSVTSPTVSTTLAASTVPTTGANDTQSSSLPIAAIAGGVVGALVLIAIGVIAFLIIRRRNSNKAGAAPSSFIVHQQLPAQPSSTSTTPSFGTSQKQPAQQAYGTKLSSAAYFPQQPSQQQPYSAAPSVTSSYSTPTATGSYGSPAPQAYALQNPYLQQQPIAYDQLELTYGNQQTPQAASGYQQAQQPVYGYQQAPQPSGGYQQQQPPMPSQKY
ncbi:hypothetical protein HDU96_008778 [Phlyctochytrium bullatum]|nr:hypothetical protein HDU96_008778 [Phlyctochytrium bullatum]